MLSYIVGVDIGGTACKLGLFTEDGQLVNKWQIATDVSDSGKHILDNIINSINHHAQMNSIQMSQIAGIGIGVPGPVTANGTVLVSVNLGWENYPVIEEMEKRIPCRVRVGNDVNIAALGELWQGAAMGTEDVIVITLGTGVGGGIVVKNRVVSGFFGSAGEIGHIIVNREETELCACGRKGCLEQYVSATGISRIARIRLKKSNKRSRLRGLSRVTAKDVFDQAKSGDELAIEIVDDFGKILGCELANLACLVNPEVIVIGGGVSKAGEILIDAVQKYFDQNVLFTCKNTRISLASLGNDAGIYGAARMALEQ